MQSEKRYTLITGATSGIGYELARLFGSMGHHLILVARTESDLLTAKKEFSDLGMDIITIPKDLFEPRAAAELYQDIKNRRLEVDVLVNDAGQGSTVCLLKTISIGTCS